MTTWPLPPHYHTAELVTMMSRKLHRHDANSWAQDFKWNWSVMCSLSSHFWILPAGVHKAISSPSSLLQEDFSPLEPGIALPPPPASQSIFHTHTPWCTPAPISFVHPCSSSYSHLWALPLSPPGQHRGQKTTCRRSSAVVKAAGTLLSLSTVWIGCSDHLEAGLWVGQPIRGAVPCFPPPHPQHRRAPLMVGLEAGSSPSSVWGQTRWWREVVSSHIPLNHAMAAKQPLEQLAKAAHTEKVQISRTVLRGESLLYPWSPSSPKPQAGQALEGHRALLLP